MKYLAEHGLEAFESPLVDDELFFRGLGGSKSDIGSARLYLQLPIAARPQLSWFFDRDFYLKKYPDIDHAEVDPLIHFLLWGIKEGRSPHPLIDIEYIRSTYGSSAFSAQPDCEQLHALLVNDLVDPSPFFSREHYARQCSAAGQEPKSGLLHNFLQYGILNQLSPGPGIDVMMCYLQFGGGFDIRSGLRQFVLLGERPNIDAALPPEWQAKTLFRSRARSLLPVFARQPLNFQMSRPPELSVVMVLHNQFDLTLSTLASLRNNFAGNIELVVVDSGSTDETVHLRKYVYGCELVRLEVNVGFVRAASAAMELVSSEYVLFLNNDVELAYGAVYAALHRIDSDPKIGAVGAKIIRSDGHLQEAGGIVWRDGSTSGYLRDESPLVGEANFVRDVEFCSMAFLLARVLAVRDVGGLDLDFAPAYYEDTDLCLRLVRSGHRIVYDPQVVVYHLEYGSSLNATHAHAMIAKSHSVFTKKHQNALQRNYCRSAGADLFARSVREYKHRVLFIESRIPLRRLGSGFVRSNDIIRGLAALGYAVTIYPIEASDFGPAETYADFPDTVEVMCGVSLAQFREFTTRRRGYYDIVWVCRTPNLQLVKALLDENCREAKVILDTEAIASIREYYRIAATSFGTSFDLEASIEKEFSQALTCSSLVAVSDAEARILRGLGHRNIATLGHVRDPSVTGREFAHRSGMLFVGAIHSVDSPNYESLLWFVDEVLPRIESALGWETRLTVAGYTAVGIDLQRLRTHPRITLLGTVADLEPLYDSHRVFVAPTRFAAGMPYKLHEAASFGIPVVTTKLILDQIGWENGADLLAADGFDAEGFACCCVRLYHSEKLWTQLRGAALKRVMTECGRSDFEAKLAEILGTSDEN